MIRLVIEYLDKPLLRMHRKVGERWENKGHSIYSLSSAVGLPSYMIGFISVLVAARGYAMYPVGLSWGLTLGQDFLYNLNGLFKEFKEDNYNSETRVVDYRKYASDKLIRPLRLPAFLSGTGFIGKIGFDTFRYGFNSLDRIEGFYIAIGLGLLGLASSMYLKDKDPKHLEKQPSKLKAKLKELANKIKQRVPVPAPQPSFQNLYEQMLYSI